jgi:hypothetical protein
MTQTYGRHMDSANSGDFSRRRSKNNPACPVLECNKEASQQSHSVRYNTRDYIHL